MAACCIGEPFLYPLPPYGWIDPRLGNPNAHMPFSQFCSTPFRSVTPGPFIRGARQNLRDMVTTIPTGLAPPGAVVNQHANLCTSGRIGNGMCLA